MTIRKRLTFSYASLLTLIIVLVGAVVFLMMRWTLINELDITLDETAELINDNSKFLPLPPTFDRDTPFGIDLPPLDVFRASGVEVQVWLRVDEQWQFIAASANLENYSLPLDDSALGVTQATHHNVSIDGSEWRVRTSPIYYQDALVGSIQVAGSLHTVNQATKGLLAIILISCGVAVLGSALLSYMLAGRVLQPVEEITRAAAYIAGTKDLSTRLEWHGPMDELGQLNAVFNRMMERLEHLFSVQQRFVADISHELRTPLTGIRGNVEMMKRYGVDEESLQALHEDSERMSHLINDLLLLARADYGGTKIDMHALDLDGVVAAVYGQMQPNAQERGITLSLARVEPLRINGSPDRLKQMLTNLVDNALKFTPSGGTVTLSLRRTGDYAVIRVQDTGMGIPQEDLPRIFDRFYQSDKARTHTGGFGLGLSIAKWIIDAHKGTVSVSTHVDQGTCFTVSLPLYPAAEGDPQHFIDPHARVTRPRVAISRRSPGPHHHTTTSQTHTDAYPPQS